MLSACRSTMRSFRVDRAAVPGARGMEEARRRAQQISVVDGAMHAVMVGASESFQGTLAVELGHGPFGLALLTTVPLLIGSISQLASSALIARLRSRKRFVVAGAAAQALCHLGFFYMAAAEVRSLSYF